MESKSRVWLGVRFWFDCRVWTSCPGMPYAFERSPNCLQQNSFGVLSILHYVNMFFPTIFMAVVYFKIGRALIKQNKYIKSVCSNPVEQSVPSSSFNILKNIRNRKTFFICLVTVLCYGVGNIPVTVYYIWKIVEEYHLKTKYIWIFYLADVLRVAGSYSVNPLIYGILDKKLFTFWKLCQRKKRR